MNEKTKVDLNDLTRFCKLSPVRCANFAEAAAVCLENQGHVPDVQLTVRGTFRKILNLEWQKLDPVIYES